ncbi:hypothetical protein [Marinitoga sp. 1155]|uniref:hypothetical protein n=1 Tax=Marinitoga sp. 1155 TaxID=1428448 RepID=UPI000658953C|nr:hypothetical protein [Marinitoga sp. 1155]KLO24772.1 hypothetical protein X274_02100 [Marinitoga sp. 1155]
MFGKKKRRKSPEVSLRTGNRLLEIINESIYIINTSSNYSTIISRCDLVVDYSYKLLKMHENREIKIKRKDKKEFKKTIYEMHTIREEAFENLINEIVEKAENRINKLKSKDPKIKAIKSYIEKLKKYETLIKTRSNKKIYKNALYKLKALKKEFKKSR